MTPHTAKRLDDGAQNLRGVAAVLRLLTEQYDHDNDLAFALSLAAVNVDREAEVMGAAAGEVLARRHKEVTHG